MITTLFFDLDGTLLPMDLSRFTHDYVSSISRYMTQFGFDPKVFGKAIFEGVNRMCTSSKETNEKLFWDYLASYYGHGIYEYIPAVDQYYRTDFKSCQAACPADPRIPVLIEKAKDLGFRLALATNPIFPRIAVEERVRWSGLNPEDFEYLSTYENSCYTKPDPHYFQEIADRMGVHYDEVLMVGNDLREDAGARDAGMSVYYLTDWLVENQAHDLEEFTHGTVEDFSRYLETINH